MKKICKMRCRRFVVSQHEAHMFSGVLYIMHGIEDGNLEKIKKHCFQDRWEIQKKKNQQENQQINGAESLIAH